MSVPNLYSLQWGRNRAIFWSPLGSLCIAAAAGAVAAVATRRRAYVANDRPWASSCPLAAGACAQYVAATWPVATKNQFGQNRKWAKPRQYSMPLVPLFRQSPFRRFRQIFQPASVVDTFDEIFEMEIV